MATHVLQVKCNIHNTYNKKEKETAMECNSRKNRYCFLTDAKEEDCVNGSRTDGKRSRNRPEIFISNGRFEYSCPDIVVLTFFTYAESLNTFPLSFDKFEHRRFLKIRV